MSKINEKQSLSAKGPRKLRILLAPLDWGLGHATRCIPVIYELLSQDVDVWLAGEGAQEEILKKEFPELPFLTLEGYRVSYARSASGLLRNMVFQTPRLLRMIRKENKWLAKAIAEHQLDAVISDNRYGLYSKKVPTVIITHQLAIRSPFASLNGLLRKINYSYINRFGACWIPDESGSSNFAGLLSHPSQLPAIPIAYTGILSRLQKTGIEEKKGHLFISLSGPEPQRSLLETKVIDAVSHYPGTATIVRGLPDSESYIPSTNDIQFYNHLPSVAYGKEMEKAEWVICRSGYSTVMDILRLGKKSILIPTPGQTEQEYLAVHLQDMQVACAATQQDFNLDQMLLKASTFNYRMAAHSSSAGLQKNIADFLRLVKA